MRTYEVIGDQLVETDVPAARLAYEARAMSPAWQRPCVMHAADDCSRLIPCAQCPAVGVTARG